jgi:hypothetical protein
VVLPEPAKDEDEARIWSRVWRVLGRVGGGPALVTEGCWSSLSGAAEEPAQILRGRLRNTTTLFGVKVYCKSLTMLNYLLFCSFQIKVDI